MDPKDNDPKPPEEAHNDNNNNPGDQPAEPTFDEDDEEMTRFLWEVQTPDLSVIHSMPTGEPFSHEGNALFELIERSKRLQEEQEADRRTRRRSEEDDNAIIDALLQWPSPPPQQQELQQPPPPPQPQPTNNTPPVPRWVTGGFPAPPAPLGPPSAASFLPNYGGSSIGFSDFSAGSSSSGRDDKGKGVLVEPPPPQPSSRPPSLRQVRWDLFDPNAIAAAAGNPGSGDGGRVVHWSERDYCTTNYNPNARQEMMNIQQGGTAAVNNTPWLGMPSNEQVTGSNYDFGPPGFSQTQVGLQNPEQYVEGSIQGSWNPAGFPESENIAHLFAEGNMGVFPSALGYANVDPSQTLGPPPPHHHNHYHLYHHHHDPTQVRESLLHVDEETRQGGIQGQNTGQMLGNPTGQMILRDPGQGSGQQLPDDQMVNPAEADNHRHITTAVPGFGFKTPLMFFLPKHPNCDSCDVLRQTTHSTGPGMESRVVELHRNASGIFHIVASIMVTSCDDQLTAPTFQFDHFFHTFLGAENFLSDYFKYHNALNKRIFRDHISNLYTAIRLQYIYDEDGPGAADTVVDPVDLFETVDEPLVEGEEAPHETSSKDSDSSMQTKSESEDVTGPRVKEATLTVPRVSEGSTPPAPSASEGSTPALPSVNEGVTAPSVSEGTTAPRGSEGSILATRVSLGAATPSASVGIPRLPTGVSEGIAGLLPRVSEGMRPLPFGRSNISEQRKRTGRMTLEEIQEFMHLPLTEAAAMLHVCSTVLKKISRKYGITRWPYRKIKALDRTLSGLERARETGEQEESVEAEIKRIREQKEKLRNPRPPPKK
ncbi:hypothetical protein H6P81_007810 [Aristolochia fimbriata]|uniref:RWP-RK domain-containing protein n=1 Tax=Aristolochia fimbriata TaxID=158543 RepID=A0AAV7F4Z1_ARIFI|nr:hypothetical protein H6P81_007810 [Aristolochia fimbriata]